ncbi:unnamed protein product [Mesocestoides corti]|uniref:G-protein coupled receptors family 1 profile domain-containing protein n=2 Tax=Mesocestoides corti TaxID=53468 RepID=A0A0R3ULL1_MESCO|nr:unnamed protein product [Mesocestoides corti]
MNPRSCFHRDFGITYNIVVLASLINDNVMGAMFLRGFPWLGVPAIDFAITSHRSCKFIAFLTSFLCACRANLLLAHCLLHVFSVELHSERKTINITMGLLNMACVLVAAFMAAASPIVHGVWAIGNRFACLPDPEWPHALVIFYMVHKALFCDALAQSLVILIACFQLYQIRQHLRQTAICLRFNSESKFLLFSSLQKLREKTLRTCECLRVVYVHAGFIATLRIIQGCVTFAFANVIYGSGRRHVFESGVRETLVSYFATFDLINLCEVIANLLHTWVIYFWQMTMRNALLRCLISLFRPFKKLRDSLHGLLYTDRIGFPKEGEDNVPKERRSEPSKRREVDRAFLEYMWMLSSWLNEKELKGTLEWLVNEQGLPEELEVFMKENKILV